MNKKEIDKEIINSDEKNYLKINWTKAWGKKYPILVKYQNEVEVSEYAKEIRLLLNKLKQDYKYSELDAMLVLKDILAHEYMNNQKRNN